MSNTKGDDIAGGIANGFLGLLGLGQAYDPLGKLRSDLSQKTSEFNSMTASYAYQAAFQNNKNLAALDDMITGKTAALEAHNDVTSNLIWNSLETENLFVTFLYVLVFVIIIYLLVKT